MPLSRDVAAVELEMYYKLLCIVRAGQRTHNTKKLVQKDYLRRSRNVYGSIAPTVCNAITNYKRRARIGHKAVVLSSLFALQFLMILCHDSNSGEYHGR